MATIESYVEQAVYDALRVVLPSTNIVPFVAVEDQNEDAEKKVVYPCVQVAADPFIPISPGAPMGDVTVRLAARTQADDDSDRSDLDDLYAAANGVMDRDILGPYTTGEISIFGVLQEDGGISVDPERKTQDKGSTYKVAVYIVPVTTT